MPRIKIASFNIEWMNDWFVADSQSAAFRPTFTRDSQLNDTATTCGRAADLIRAIDADVIALQEAASRSQEVELFINDFLSDAGAPIYHFLLGSSGGAQKLALLWKPTSVSVEPAPPSSIVQLHDPFDADVDADGLLEEYEFTRKPLVANVTVSGHALQIVVMHTKSNFINNGQSLWLNLATRQEYVVQALKSRRRISAEGVRTRTYLDGALALDPNVRIVVLGDLNDGPGRDYFEEKYLSHSVTDAIAGSVYDPEGNLNHAQHDVPPAQRFTAIFDDFVTGENQKRVLLDHILLSPGLSNESGLHVVPGSGAVAHTEFSSFVANQGLKREDRPSDHRPVSVLLEF